MFRGQLKKWDDAKGFGFIKSEDLELDTFIHVSALKHMSRKPKKGDFIYFDIEQLNGKTRATNARIEGVKANSTFKVAKGYKRRSSNKFTYVLVALVILAFSYQRIGLHGDNQATHTNYPSESTKTISSPQQFTCDGRQYCSQMTSRAEAEFFTKYCPNTKMDGDSDGIPCENDTRF